MCRDCWQLYASHRRHVTQLLLAGGSIEHTRLAVLGAGNCNDLDLQTLAEHYREIHLVDIDGEALKRGVSQQGMVDQRQLVLYPGVDLTGLTGWLSGWKPDSPPDASAVDEIIAGLPTAPAFRFDSPVDVVISVCLLSQIVESIGLSIGQQHPRFLPLLDAVRIQHLRMMAGCLRPGGRFLLVTDFVSSGTCPELAQTTEEQLPDLAKQLIVDRNFFTGLNPFVLQSLLSSDPCLSADLEHIHLFRPWLWSFPTRVYAVAAIQAVRRGGDIGSDRDACSGVAPESAHGSCLRT
jgi:hypothetical protein